MVTAASGGRRCSPRRGMVVELWHKFGEGCSAPVIVEQTNHNISDVGGWSAPGLAGVTRKRRKEWQRRLVAFIAQGSTLRRRGEGVGWQRRGCVTSCRGGVRPVTAARARWQRCRAGGAGKQRERDREVAGRWGHLSGRENVRGHGCRVGPVQI
jgi:hypothetical protein